MQLLIADPKILSGWIPGDAGTGEVSSTPLFFIVNTKGPSEPRH
jgi:hypothetical protein